MIEISLKSLDSIIKSKSLKATLWTDNAGINSAELLINLQSDKKKISKLKQQKQRIFKKFSKEKQVEINKFLKEDFVIKKTYQVY